MLSDISLIPESVYLCSFCSRSTIVPSHFACALCGVGSVARVHTTMTPGVFTLETQATLAVSSHRVLSSIGSRRALTSPVFGAMVAGPHNTAQTAAAAVEAGLVADASTKDSFFLSAMLISHTCCQQCVLFRTARQEVLPMSLCATKQVHLRECVLWAF